MPAPRSTESWESRIARVHRDHPAAAGQVDWPLKMNEYALAGLLFDMVAIARPHTRTGGRPIPNPEEAGAELREMFGIDAGYSVLPFDEEFRLLAKVRDRSVRGIAAKAGMQKNRVHRLLTGQLAPTMWEMEQIARVFNKTPSHFREYRALAAGAAVAEALYADPDRSAVVHRQLRRSAAAG